MTTYRCKEITPSMMTDLLSFSGAANLSLVYGLSDLYVVSYLLPSPLPAADLLLAKLPLVCGFSDLYGVGIL
jgi:hypothetical protein